MDIGDELLLVQHKLLPTPRVVSTTPLGIVLLISKVGLSKRLAVEHLGDGVHRIELVGEGGSNLSFIMTVCLTPSGIRWRSLGCAHAP